MIRPTRTLNALISQYQDPPTWVDKFRAGPCLDLSGLVLLAYVRMVCDPLALATMLIAYRLRWWARSLNFGSQAGTWIRLDHLTETSVDGHMIKIHLRRGALA